MTVSHKLDSLQHATYSSLNKPHHPWKMSVKNKLREGWTSNWLQHRQIVGPGVEWTSDQPSKSCNNLLTFHFSSKAWRGYVIKKKGTWNQIPTSNMKYSTPAWFAWQINVSRNFCNASMTLQSSFKKNMTHTWRFASEASEGPSVAVAGSEDFWIQILVMVSVGKWH